MRREWIPGCPDCENDKKIVAEIRKMRAWYRYLVFDRLIATAEGEDWLDGRRAKAMRHAYFYMAESHFPGQSWTIYDALLGKSVGGRVVPG